MVVKITILLWFVCFVWRFLVMSHINTMSIIDMLSFEREDKKPFWYWGLGILLIFNIIMSFASLIWLLFLR